MPGESPGPILDIVTVVYSRELDLLRLQARSIARFLAPDGIGRIQVIVNDRDHTACLAAVESMRPDYGPFRSNLEILRPDDLVALRPAEFRPRGPGQRFRTWFTRHRSWYPIGVKGGWRGNRGWSVQQALKLLAARAGTSAFVLILDAKNHFVAPVSVTDFVGPQGRARVYTKRANDKQRAWIEASFRCIGAKLPDREAPVPPSVTPVVVARAVLRGALEALERRAGPAEAYFTRRKLSLRKKTRGSEFMMIFAHVVEAYRGLDEVFDPGLLPAATIHRGMAPADVDRTLSRVEAGQAKILSVHASRIGSLEPEVKRRLRAIWASRGLDAAELVAGFEPM